jgi:hypothetical protein
MSGLIKTPGKHKDRPRVSQIAKRANEIWVGKGSPKGEYPNSWHEAEAELRKLLTGVPHQTLSHGISQ